MTEKDFQSKYGSDYDPFGIKSSSKNTTSFSSTTYGSGFGSSQNTSGGTFSYDKDDKYSSKTSSSYNAYNPSGSSSFYDGSYKPSYQTQAKEYDRNVSPNYGFSYDKPTSVNFDDKWGGDQPSTNEAPQEGKDSRIQNYALRLGVSAYDPENMKYYHFFNLKRTPYKLKHYMYYSNELNMDFDIQNYNKLAVKMGRPPRLSHYMRFYDMKYENELNPVGKHYGNFYTLTDDNQNPNIVYNKEYKGVYSNQLDFVNFKLALSQEKVGGNK
jgi:hypothetical protein